jgi:hypothetical protein
VTIKRWLLAGALLLAAALAYWLGTVVVEFLAVDSCLDSGGRWVDRACIR